VDQRRRPRCGADRDTGDDITTDADCKVVSLHRGRGLSKTFGRGNKAVAIRGEEKCTGSVPPASELRSRQSSAEYRPVRGHLRLMFTHCAEAAPTPQEAVQPSPKRGGCHDLYPHVPARAWGHRRLRNGQYVRYGQARGRQP